MKKFYVYTHKINGKVFYVGSAQGNPDRAYSITYRPEKWHEIVSKNNGEYDIEIVSYYEDKIKAQKAEIKLIHYYHDIGQAEASSQDFRKENNSFYRKSHTEEFKKATSKRMKGKRHSLGYTHTPEAIEKIRKHSSGDNNARAIILKITFLSGEEKIFGSYKSASEELSIDARQLRKIANTNKKYVPAKNVRNKYGHLEGIVVNFEEKKYESY